MSTYRERREAKAERYREWAESRERKADQAYERVSAISDRIPLGQPILVGHHSERGARADQRRIEQGMNSFCEHNATAREFRGRADNIEHQAKRAIYSDDADALERLREKLATLEARREQYKAENTAYKREHKAELKAIDSAFWRNRALPHPSYEIQNLGGTISTTRKRIQQLEREQAAQASGVRTGGRRMVARYGGECAECGGTVDRGDTMTYYRATREVVCFGCES